MPVHARIAFKVLLISFKVIKDVPLKYLADLIAVLPTSSYDLCRNNNGIVLARKHINIPLGRTRKFLSPPSTGGRGLMEALPRVFDMLQYVETILSSVESL